MKKALITRIIPRVGDDRQDPVNGLYSALRGLIEMPGKGIKTCCFASGENEKKRKPARDFLPL